MGTGGQGDRGREGDVGRAVSPSESPPLYLASEGIPLRVRFEHIGDRYRHMIEAESDAVWHDAFASLEGTPGERFPPSPPLQSLSIEELAPGRRAALLVGMAGTSHWSLSVELDPVGRIVFDAACRPGEAGWLGSSYLLAQRCNLTFTPDPATGLAPQLTRERERITLAAPPPASAKVRTIRWRYSVSRGS